MTQDILGLDSRISLEDSRTKGTKDGARGTEIELDELYRMHYLLFL